MGDYCPDGAGQQYKTRQSSSRMPAVMRTCACRPCQFTTGTRFAVRFHATIVSGSARRCSTSLPCSSSQVGNPLSSTRVDSGKDLRALKKQTKGENAAVSVPTTPLVVRIPSPPGLYLRHLYSLRNNQDEQKNTDAGRRLCRRLLELTPIILIKNKIN